MVACGQRVRPKRALVQAIVVVRNLRAGELSEALPPAQPLPRLRTSFVACCRFDVRRASTKRCDACFGETKSVLKIVCPFHAAEMVDTLSPALGLSSPLRCLVPTGTRLTGGVHNCSGDILMALHGRESTGIPMFFGTSTTHVSGRHGRSVSAPAISTWASESFQLPPSCRPWKRFVANFTMDRFSEAAKCVACALGAQTVLSPPFIAHGQQGKLSDQATGFQAVPSLS